MKNSIKSLITLLVFLGGLLYLLVILWTGIISFRGSVKPDPFFVSVVVVIGGVLSTNMGAVLGVTLTPPSAPNRQPSFMGLRPSLKPATQTIAAGDEPTQTQKFQVLACWVYVIGLLIAFVCWCTLLIMSKGNQAAPLLPELSKTLMGVIVGAFAVKS
jgi:hypothetical protein